MSLGRNGAFDRALRELVGVAGSGGGNEHVPLGRKRLQGRPFSEPRVIPRARR